MELWRLGEKREPADCFARFNCTRKQFKENDNAKSNPPLRTLDSLTPQNAALVLVASTHLNDVEEQELYLYSSSKIPRPQITLRRTSYGKRSPGWFPLSAWNQTGSRRSPVPPGSAVHSPH